MRNPRLCLLLQLTSLPSVLGNPQARRLFEDLLSGYNKLIRPVANNTDLLAVKFKLRLSQLLDVHEKNQIMTTNVWLEHEWYDLKLRWRPEEYGGVEVLYVPGEMIWLPDIVLYNNADGNYQITIMTKATVHHSGRVNWDPPAIYKSMCQIDVEWFPFDTQSCHMKFGSWTYDGFQVDLLHKAPVWAIAKSNRSNVLTECVEAGIDLSDYYRSTEWDIIAVPGKKKKAKYPCCPTPYIDITYHINLRRKTLFYTVNLILPCIGISFLTVLVFYLPSDSGEKVTLSISILISLTVFFLLLVEIIPSTSLVVPLIGKYLLFTMVMVTLSICITVVVINIHFRSPRTHTMSAWLRRVFLEVLPRWLWMSRPPLSEAEEEAASLSAPAARMFAGLQGWPGDELRLWPETSPSLLEAVAGGADEAGLRRAREKVRELRRARAEGRPRSHVATRVAAETERAMDGVAFIAQHLRAQETDQKVMEEWKFVAMVMDRMFLYLFSAACLLGTASIILQAPSLYDQRRPIDVGDQHLIHRLNGVRYCTDPD